MRLVVISPPEDVPDERAIYRALFEAGLERLHLRKPAWTEADTAGWLESLPATWRTRVVLHAHHGLRAPLGAGGVHFRDDGAAPEEPRVVGGFVSRSCHDAAAVERSLGRYDAVLVGPVFASHSKPGYGPLPRRERDALRDLMATRSTNERTTEVIAIGGVDRSTLERCRAIGFDGAAVLGAVWQAHHPVTTFLDLRAAADTTTQPTEGRASP
jgi:thiamine-phosphate pyrophosphorylase